MRLGMDTERDVAEALRAVGNWVSHERDRDTSEPVRDCLGELSDALIAATAALANYRRHQAALR